MPQIHQSFLYSLELQIEEHHSIKEEVLLIINSWTTFDKQIVGSQRLLVLFFWPALSPQLSFNLQASSPCSSAWCPAMTTACPHCSSAPVVLSASPHLNLAQHPPWPSTSQRKSKAYRYQLDISQFIAITQFRALICIPFCSTATGWVLTSHGGEVNGYFYKEGSVPYYHFPALCL